MRRAATAGVVVAALVLAHAAGWWWLSRRVQSGFEAWAAAQRAAGLTVTSGETSLAGWPLDAGIAVADLAFGRPGGWQWTAPRVDVAIRPPAFDRLRITPHGHQSLTAGTGAPGAGLDAGSLLVTLTLPAGDDPGLDASGVVLTTPDGPVRADRLGGQTLTNPGTTGFTAQATGVTLPPGPPYLLGPAIAELGATVTSAQGLPAPRLADLAAWRDAGGTVRLDAFRLRWGVLTADATGTASLDRTLQPVADLRVALTGQEAALDAATAQGLLQPRAALAVRAVLSLLSRATPAPGGAPGALPVSVRDGSIAIAGFPVARVPPVVWPAR